MRCPPKSDGESEGNRSPVSKHEAPVAEQLSSFSHELVAEQPVCGCFEQVGPAGKS